MYLLKACLLNEKLDCAHHALTLKKAKESRGSLKNDIQGHVIFKVIHLKSRILYRKRTLSYLGKSIFP